MVGIKHDAGKTRLELLPVDALECLFESYAADPGETSTSDDAAGFVAAREKLFEFWSVPLFRASTEPLCDALVHLLTELTADGAADGFRARESIIDTEADLWPGLWLVADVLTEGAKKYADRNWENGLKYSHYYGAALRHLYEYYIVGNHDDAETGLDHRAHAACCILFLLTYELRDMGAEFDDRRARVSRRRADYTVGPPDLFRF